VAVQDLLNRILAAKPAVLDLSAAETDKLSAYLKTHPHRRRLSEEQRASRGDSVLRAKLDADRNRRDHLKLVAEYNRDRPRADAQRQARISGRLGEPDRLSAIVRLRWLFADTITRIETAEPDSHPSDLVVRADEIMELTATLGIRPIPMSKCEHKDSGDVHVGMNDPTGDAGCGFVLWNPLDATGGKTVAMFLRMCRLWVS